MTEPTNPSTAKTGKSYAAARPKVPPFARYEGTSAWRKNKRRVRAYAAFRAAAAESEHKPVPQQV